MDCCEQQNEYSGFITQISCQQRLCRMEHKFCQVSIILFGCETWLLTLREERRLRVFENRVLMRIFGPKRDEVTGEWRRLFNEEVYALYTSPNNIRVIK